jgi:hypothetical protein
MYAFEKTNLLSLKRKTPPRLLVRGGANKAWSGDEDAGGKAARSSYSIAGGKSSPCNLKVRPSYLLGRRR